MDSQVHLDPEVLVRELKQALRHGCRASRLLRYAPALVDLIVTPDGQPPVGRAHAAEQTLKDACATYEGDWGEAMLCLLGLAPGTHGTHLKVRRRQAADLLEVPVETFRRHHEHQVLWDLAVVVAIFRNP